MSDQLATNLVRLGAVLAVVLLWAASMIFIYRDMARRNLPAWQQSLWVIVSLIPFLGFVAYVAALPVSGAASRRRSAQPSGSSRRVTMLQPLPANLNRRLPTIAAVPPAAPAAAGTLGQTQAAHTARLSIIEGPHRGQEFAVHYLPARIGREVDCAVLLDKDLGVSRRHAELISQGGALWLRDLGSKHGTLVNGRRIDERELAFGDKIRIGDSVLVVKTGR